MRENPGTSSHTGPERPEALRSFPKSGVPVTAPSSEAGRRAAEGALIIRNGRATDVADLLAMIRELASFENLEEELEVTAASLQDSLFGRTRRRPCSWRWSVAGRLCHLLPYLFLLCRAAGHLPG